MGEAARAPPGATLLCGQDAPPGATSWRRAMEKRTLGREAIGRGGKQGPGRDDGDSLRIACPPSCDDPVVRTVPATCWP